MKGSPWPPDLQDAHIVRLKSLDAWADVEELATASSAKCARQEDPEEGRDLEISTF